MSYIEVNSIKKPVARAFFMLFINRKRYSAKKKLRSIY